MTLKDGLVVLVSHNTTARSASVESGSVETIKSETPARITISWHMGVVTTFMIDQLAALLYIIWCVNGIITVTNE